MATPSQRFVESLRGWVQDASKYATQLQRLAAALQPKDPTKLTNNQTVVAAIMSS